jgi:SAM-dependent methyltransferase
MAKARNYFAWQNSLVTREIGRRVVEVGCGFGNFTRLLLDREVVIAIDREPDCVERLRERYPNQKNLQTFVCDASDRAFAGLARFQADSCVCLNVLEHMQDDQKALEDMASILVPGGVIVLILPAFAALYGPIDANLGHLRRYRRGSIRRIANGAGLRIKRMHHMNFIGFFGWWVNSRILRREAQSAFQISVFDKFVVPVASRLEGWLTPPFGQSLFVVLQKQ